MSRRVRNWCDICRDDDPDVKCNGENCGKKFHRDCLRTVGHWKPQETASDFICPDCQEGNVNDSFCYICKKELLAGKKEEKTRRGTRRRPEEDEDSDSLPPSGKLRRGAGEDAGEDSYVLCDGCTKSAHVKCLGLKEVSYDEQPSDTKLWFCPECDPHSSTAAAMTRQRQSALPKTSEEAAAAKKKLGNSDTCYICQKGGKLLGCDVCVHSFHPRCLDVDFLGFEASCDWVCPICKGIDPLTHMGHKRMSRTAMVRLQKEWQDCIKKQFRSCKVNRDLFLQSCRTSLRPFVSQNVWAKLEAAQKSKGKKKMKQLKKEELAQLESREAERMFSEALSIAKKESRDFLKEGISLKNYQCFGVGWLLYSFYNKAGAILADEMGLGKTIQCLSFLSALKLSHVTGPHLVVVPLSTVGNWMREIRKFVPHLKSVKICGSRYEREHSMSDAMAISGLYDLYITTYETVVSEEWFFCDNFQWQCVILDEAHRIKNESGKMRHSLDRVAANMRVLLTGTPLQNNVKELFTLLNFLFPDILKTSDAFEQVVQRNARAAKSGEKPTRQQMSLETAEGIDAVLNQDAVEAVSELLSRLMLRRTKDLVVKLPKKIEHEIWLPLEAEAAFWYKKLLKVSEAAFAQNSVRKLLGTVVKMRICCCHPRGLVARDAQLGKLKEVFAAELTEGVDHPEEQRNEVASAAGTLLLKDGLQHIGCSSKLVFLDKLLMELHTENLLFVEEYRNDFIINKRDNLVRFSTPLAVEDLEVAPPAKSTTSKNSPKDGSEASAKPPAKKSKSKSAHAAQVQELARRNAEREDQLYRSVVDEVHDSVWSRFGINVYDPNMIPQAIEDHLEFVNRESMREQIKIDEGGHLDFRHFMLAVQEESEFESGKISSLLPLMEKGSVEPESQEEDNEEDGDDDSSSSSSISSEERLVKGTRELRRRGPDPSEIVPKKKKIGQDKGKDIIPQGLTARELRLKKRNRIMVDDEDDDSSSEDAEQVGAPRPDVRSPSTTSHSVSSRLIIGESEDVQPVSRSDRETTEEGDRSLSEGHQNGGSREGSTYHGDDSELPSGAPVDEIMKDAGDSSRDTTNPAEGFETPAVKNLEEATGAAEAVDLETAPECSSPSVEVGSSESLLKKKETKRTHVQHKVLVLTQFQLALDELERYCKFRGFRYLRLDGGTNKMIRELDIREFNSIDSTHLVYLICTRAGGIGINLVTANHVVLYDEDWNPFVDLQAVDRAHRIGQKRDVNVWKLATEWTVEERMAFRRMQKLKLDKMLIQAKTEVVDMEAQMERRLEEDEEEKVSVDEIRRLIRHGRAAILSIVEPEPLMNKSLHELMQRQRQDLPIISTEASSEAEDNEPSLPSETVSAEDIIETGVDSCKRRISIDVVLDETEALDGPIAGRHAPVVTEGASGAAADSQEEEPSAGAERADEEEEETGGRRRRLRRVTRPVYVPAPVKDPKLKQERKLIFDKKCFKCGSGSTRQVIEKPAEDAKTRSVSASASPVSLKTKAEPKRNVEDEQSSEVMSQLSQEQDLESNVVPAETASIADKENISIGGSVSNPPATSSSLASSEPVQYAEDPLVKCFRCPRVYHLHQCLEMEQEPRKTWMCPWHECSLCFRKGSQAGGLLIHCAECPTAFCFDCFPPEYKRYSPPVSYFTDLQRHGFNATPEKFVLFLCSRCKAVKEQNRRRMLTKQQLESELKSRRDANAKAREDAQKKTEHTASAAAAAKGSQERKQFMARKKQVDSVDKDIENSIRTGYENLFPAVYIKILEGKKVEAQKAVSPTSKQKSPLVKMPSEFLRLCENCRLPGHEATQCPFPAETEKKKVPIGKSSDHIDDGATQAQVDSAGEPIGLMAGEQSALEAEPIPATNADNTKLKEKDEPKAMMRSFCPKCGISSRSHTRRHCDQLSAEEANEYETRRELIQKFVAELQTRPPVEVPPTMSTDAENGDLRRMSIRCADAIVSDCLQVVGLGACVTRGKQLPTSSGSTVVKPVQPSTLKKRKKKSDMQDTVTGEGNADSDYSPKKPKRLSGSGYAEDVDSRPDDAAGPENGQSKRKRSFTNFLHMEGASTDYGLESDNYPSMTVEIDSPAPVHRKSSADLRGPADDAKFYYETPEAALSPVPETNEPAKKKLKQESKSSTKKPEIKKKSLPVAPQGVAQKIPITSIPFYNAAAFSSMFPPSQRQQQQMQGPIPATNAARLPPSRWHGGMMPQQGQPYAYPGYGVQAMMHPPAGMQMTLAGWAQPMQFDVAHAYAQGRELYARGVPSGYPSQDSRQFLSVPLQQQTQAHHIAGQGSDQLMMQSSSGGGSHPYNAGRGSTAQHQMFPNPNDSK